MPAPGNLIIATFGCLYGPDLRLGQLRGRSLARIFISHSSQNNDWAIRVRDWLKENGWDDIFLDIDPMRGIAADERWKAALHEAADQCDVVLALVSPRWLASDWCKAETEAALRMGKRIIVALIGAVPLDLTDEQWVDLADPDGFSQLKESLRRLGLDPSTESVHVQKFPARETHDAPVAPSAEPRVAQ